MFSLKLSDHISDKASSTDKIRFLTGKKLEVVVDIGRILGLMQIAAGGVSAVVEFRVEAEGKVSVGDKIVWQDRIFPDPE